jgi:hypothetical protein
MEGSAAFAVAASVGTIAGALVTAGGGTMGGSEVFAGASCGRMVADETAAAGLILSGD